MDENPAPKKPWWQTVPGMLTAASTSLVAITAIIGVLTPAVSVIGNFFLPNQPKGCSSRPGYPVGRWAVQDLKTTTSAQYSTFITFTGSQRGTWLASGSTGSFAASDALVPNSGVILTLKPDGQSNYESTNTLVVSGDGCRMEGTFRDTQGHFGEVTYVFAVEQKSSR